MAGPTRQPQDDEPLCEVADVETGSETELLSGTDVAGSARASWRPCQTDRHGRLGLRACTATACLGLAALFISWNGVVFGPLRVVSVQRNSVKLDIETPKHGGPGNGDPGSKCQEDEEFFGGLCYKKCMYLTDGYYPIRTSAMTCCESHPCGLFNQKHDVGFCSGFSVAGGKDGACPHPPGSCLPDEELLVGQCYKKCSLLTDGKYNHRTAPGTCCNQDSAILCLLPKTGYSKTDPSFDVGGGTGAKAGFHAPASAATDSVRSTTAAALRAATTTLEVAEEQITQPPLPDWYVEMQKARQGGATTTKAAAAAAHISATVQQVTPPPVPDWAQAATATRAPTTAATTTQTRAPATLAPTTTVATTSSISRPPSTTSLAIASASTTEVILPRRTTAQLIPAGTTTSRPGGTTVPEWLREIVAEPEEVEAATRTQQLPVRTQEEAAAPTTTAEPSSPTSSQTARAAATAPSTSTSVLDKEPHTVQVARMPDWAQEMLNEDEDEEDVSPSASESEQQSRRPQ